jgi:hypothetical protein
LLFFWPTYVMHADVSVMIMDEPRMLQAMMSSSVTMTDIRTTKHTKMFHGLLEHAFVQSLVKLKSNKFCIFWVCVCSLSYPARKAHAPCFIALCGLLAVPYFFTFPRKQHDFQGKEKLQNLYFVFWFSLHIFFKTFLIVKRIQLDINVNVHGSSCKVPVIFVRF